MSTTKRHESLRNIESLVNKYLTSMTNQAYAMGMKFGYRTEWVKGTSTIIDNNNKTCKDYYVFRFYIVNKTESVVGTIIELYSNFYPVRPVGTIEKLEELAYEEFLLNGVRQLFNTSYAMYIEQRKHDTIKAEDIKIDEKIEALKQAVDNKPKLFIPGTNIVSPKQNIVDTAPAPKSVLDIIKSNI